MEKDRIAGELPHPEIYSYAYDFSLAKPAAINF